MRLSWAQRRARPKNVARSLPAPSAARAILKERAEILRLIERLRDNRRRLEASRDPQHAKLKSSIDAGLQAQLKRLDGLRDPRRAPRAGRAGREATASSREAEAHSERADVPRGGGAAGVLQRLEERLARIEGRLDGGKAATGRKVAPPASEDYTLSGVIQGDMLSDVLQMISSNSMSGIFVIENDVATYTIHFNEGQIVHTQGGDLNGENAFFAAFASTSGRYRFREGGTVAATKTIEANTQFLILEALRRIDEQGSDGKEGDG